MGDKELLKTKAPPFITTVLFTALLYFSRFWGALSLFLFPFCLIGIPLLYYGTRAPFRTVFTDEKPVLPQLAAGLFLLMGMVVLALAFNLLYSAYLNTGRLETLRSSMTTGKNIFEIVFIIGFGEELFFRGFIFDYLNAETGNRPTAVFLSSVLFAVMHFEAKLLNGYAPALVSNIAFCFCVGLLLSCSRAYSKSASLLSAVIAHGAYWVVMPYIVQRI